MLTIISVYGMYTTKVPPAFHAGYHAFEFNLRVTLDPPHLCPVTVYWTDSVRHLLLLLAINVI
ncbi:hypothetical protein L915_04824 [Phytophthora nicotianae]|uniref:Uncharacterized protein n=1 Tax=Phytophthora nicotianae TaxID=4792 RepID=W2JH21_PHYNI|nr:hypothetical protein L915_04824 [Phytophthora nicotianae]ETL45057.1 hypothetical protein L916_04770 [Phytophthora nicotianae]